MKPLSRGIALLIVAIIVGIIAFVFAEIGWLPTSEQHGVTQHALDMGMMAGFIFGVIVSVLVLMWPYDV